MPGMGKQMHPEKNSLSQVNLKPSMQIIIVYIIEAINFIVMKPHLSLVEASPDIVIAIN